jgi:hypothetical protein
MGPVKAAMSSMDYSHPGPGMGLKEFYLGESPGQGPISS